jgi:hypothetical protein
MKNDRSERLEAIRRELQQQDQEWRRITEAVARLVDVELAVPHDVLAQIIGSTPEPPPPVLGVRV